jgi:hypothetical protein
MPSCGMCGKIVSADADYCPGCGIPLRVRPATVGAQAHVAAKGPGLGPAIAILLVGFAFAGLLVGLLVDARAEARFFGYFIAGTLAGLGVALGVKLVASYLSTERLLLIIVTWSLAWSVSWLVNTNGYIMTISESALGAIGTTLLLRSFPGTAGTRWLPILLGWVLAAMVANFFSLVTEDGVLALVFANIVEGCGGIMALREVARARTAAPAS